MKGVWQSADSLRHTIGTTMSDHTVPGVRLQATKFLEHIVLLFTADTVPVQQTGGKGITMHRLASLRTLLTPALVSCDRDTAFADGYVTIATCNAREPHERMTSCHAPAKEVLDTGA